MKPQLSIYLDLLRALAATGVFLAHGNSDWFCSGFSWLPRSGHQMVVLFFVLSGYVIAFTTEKKRGNWRVYASDRLSRLYSVIIPALFVTMALDLVGRHIAPSLYHLMLTPGHYFSRFVINGLFLQQSWGLAARPGSNAPFWSLAYEFWFYFFYGLWFYVRKPIFKVVFTLAWGLLVGWKIPMLLPVWLLGVGAFRAGILNRIEPWLGLMLAIGSGGIFLDSLSYRYDIFPLFNYAPESIVRPFCYSARPFSDFLLGGIFAVNIAGVHAFLSSPKMAAWFQVVSNPFRTIIRAIADRSFAMYLVHFPVLVFLKAIIPFDGHSPYQVGLVLTGAYILILVVAGPIERFRQFFRSLFSYCLGVDRAGAARKAGTQEPPLLTA